MVVLVIRGSFYTHYCRYFRKISFNQLYTQLEDKCHSYPISLNGKVYTSKRFSCTFSNGVSGESTAKLFSYTHLKNFKWEEAPLVNYIKLRLEKKFNTHFDYVLCHIYVSGEVPIGWHNDSESLDEMVCSVSFGITRKFRFRMMGETKGWCDEFNLEHGDLFVMERECQRKYEHCVPVEKRVKEPRINLTFRKV